MKSTFYHVLLRSFHIYCQQYFSVKAFPESVHEIYNPWKYSAPFELLSSALTSALFFLSVKLSCEITLDGGLMEANLEIFWGRCENRRLIRCKVIQNVIWTFHCKSFWKFSNAGKKSLKLYRKSTPWFACVFIVKVLALEFFSNISESPPCVIILIL